ncbi:hypothetical protein Ct9H90mP29_07400 [bacterium]|nr:MAG: hypothetical protein Ct9H90mP29_07400 [bacterium]
MILRFLYYLQVQRVKYQVATDKETGEPLIGANVMVDGTPLGAATDTDGNYFILQVSLVPTP